uniref:Cnidarian restricted protein n=1 Tax=Clytia hemisphaerica TaxID=252671 RepID=A0A7M5XHS0_9CNID
MDNITTFILIGCLICLSYSHDTENYEEEKPLTTDDLFRMMHQCKSSRRKGMCQLQVLWAALKNFQPKEDRKVKDERISGTDFVDVSDMPFHYSAMLHAKRNLDKRVSSRCEYCLKTTSYLYWGKCVNECEGTL